MTNTTLSNIGNNVTKVGENLPEDETGLSEFEKTLLYTIGALLILIIVLIVCFIVYVIKPIRKRKQIRKHSCIPYIRDPVPIQENNAERYSSRPLKQVSDPKIYESLKDLIEAPPLPPISTLPKRKPGETVELLEKLSPSNFDVEGKEVSALSLRPRQPLPNEIEAARIMASNNISQTMPRMQFPKPVPTPVMSSTMSRYTNRASPPANMRPKRPVKPEVLPPKPQSSNLLLLKPRPKSPVEVQNKHTLPPSEPDNGFQAEIELLEKLKKRALRLNPSSQEIPEQHIMNIPTIQQPQQIKHEPHINNELMEKLKKRAALIPDSQNQKEMQQPINFAHRVKKPKFKPPPPIPRRSDSEDNWVDNFDNRGSSKSIHMYNF